MPEWESLFPDLGDWTETSKPTKSYNCFAFAVGDEEKRWDPWVYYWPPNVPKGYDLEKFIRAYETEGFRQCDDGTLVEGIEKLVIYVHPRSGVEHAARQEADGKWKSKIGDFEDITHEMPESLAGKEYGEPRCFMQREHRVKQPTISENADISAEIVEDGPPSSTTPLRFGRRGGQTNSRC
jgi:hypothetical protein